MIGLVKRGLIYGIVGYLAGLLTWALALLFEDRAAQSELSWFVGVMLIFGILVGGAIGVVELVDESPKKIRGFFANFSWFLVGAFFGAIGGVLGSLIGYEVFESLTDHKYLPLFGRICGMFMVGLILGLMIGLVERLRTNSWERFTSVAIAGAFGGVLAGAFRALLVRYLEAVDSFAILLIVFGGLMVCAIAVVTSLRSSAVLMGCQDNVARTVKYGPGYEFLLSADTPILVGSGFSDRLSSRTQLKIYDDDLVDSLQADLRFSDDGWYVGPPPGFPEIGEHNYLNGRKVTLPTKLNNGDLITFGQTQFYFKILGKMVNEPPPAGHFGGVIMILLALIGFLVVPLSAHAQQMQPQTPRNLIFQCAGDVVMNDTIPLTYTMFLRTLEPDPQNPSSLIDSWLPIAQLQNDVASWTVLNDQSDVIGTVTSATPLDVKMPEVVKRRVDMILAMDLSVPKSNSALERVQQNPAILTTFLTNLAAFCTESAIELKVALLLFASDAAPIETLTLRPLGDGKALGRRLEMEIDAYLKRKECCNCTALLPAFDRGVEALTRQRGEAGVNRLMIVVSDGVHDLTEKKLPAYDCAQTARQNFTAAELNARLLESKLRKAQVSVMVFGTERLQQIGTKMADLVVQRRGEPELPVPTGKEYILLAKKEARIMTAVVMDWWKKRGGQGGGQATAAQWEIQIAPNDTSRAAALGSQQFFVTFTSPDPQTPYVITAAAPCLPRFSFMAITTLSDNVTLPRLIMILVAIVVLWVLIMLAIYVNYLMVKRRHQPLLDESEAELPSPVARRPASPLPLPKQSAPRSGYTLPASSPKPKPKPEQRKEAVRPTERPRKPEPAPTLEPPAPAPAGRPQIDPIIRPDFDDRPAPFNDFDDLLPDDNKLGH